jgi:hypothetical protein
VTPGLSFKAYLKPILHKPLPHIGCPAQTHADPFGYFFIGMPFVGKEQGLSPFAFLGSLWSLQGKNRLIGGFWRFYTRSEATNSGDFHPRRTSKLPALRKVSTASAKLRKKIIKS